MCVADYEYFLINDEPEYNVFEFDDLCSISKSLLASTTEFDCPTASLNLKLLPIFLKYLFLGPDESLPVIISFDLNWDQEKN